MKFHIKTWSLLSGMTLSLALMVGGCSPEEPAPVATPSATTEATPATPGTPSSTTEAPPVAAPAEPPAVVEPPKSETEKPAAKEEKKEEPK